MQALVDQAPAALKQVLDGASGSLIDHVSFQYRSVAVIRPWFRPEVFTSRIWRSSDPDLGLSDGADPPVGICPAYPTACVFVRNVTVVTRNATPDTSFHDLRFTLDATRLTLRRDLRVEPSILARLAVQTEAAVRLPAPVFAPAPAPVMAEMAVPHRQAFRKLDRASFSLAVAPELAAVVAARPFVRLAEVSAIAEPMRQKIMLQPGIFAVTDTTAFQPTPAVPVPTQPVPTQPEPPPPRNELSILAFICKRLPKSPDPVAELHWI